MMTLVSVGKDEREALEVEKVEFDEVEIASDAIVVVVSSTVVI